MSLALLRLYLNDRTEPYVFDDTELTDLLDGAGGDVDAAAAEGWKIKAGTVAEWYDVNIDGSALSRSDVFDHCMKMRMQYLSSSGGLIDNVRLQVTPVEESNVSEFG